MRTNPLQRRRFSIGRVVGPSTWIRGVVFSGIAVAAVALYRNPGLGDAVEAAGSPLAAVGVVLGSVPAVLLVPLVVAVFALTVVLAFVREVRRALGLTGRRRNGYDSHGHHGYDSGDVQDGLLGGLVGGVGGGFLGGEEGGGDDGGGDE